MAIVISENGIDMGGNPVSNASQIEVQENQVSPFSGFKNYIINGNFDIWQRGTVFSTSGVFCADRWYQAIGGSAYSMLHNIYPSTILVATTAANSFLNLYQAIETVTVKKLRGKTVTVSLKLQVGGTHTGGFALTARYSNSTDALVNQTTTIQSMGISATTTNTRYSLTFVVPSDAVGLRIDLENTVVQANGALYQVQEVQLEQGSIATPFEQRPYGLELSLCQRYYQVFNESELSFTFDANFAGGSQTLNSYRACRKIPLMQTMRVAPTVTRNFVNSGFSAIDIIVTTNVLHIGPAYGATTIAGNCYIYTDLSLSAEL